MSAKFYAVAETDGTAVVHEFSASAARRDWLKENDASKISKKDAGEFLGWNCRFPTGIALVEHG